MSSPRNFLVIFDCDGVLVDSERLAVSIDVRAIGLLGWALTESDVIELFLGRSDADVMAMIEQHIGRPLPHGWEEQWAAEYRCVFDEQLEAVPGITEAIRLIAAEGFQTCVASSGSLAKIRRNLSKVGLWTHFDGRVFSASEVKHGKPAPDLFHYAARRLGRPPEACVVVEDSHHGLAAARAAGMKSVGFAGGITPIGRLTNADVVITDMAALPDTVASFHSHADQH